MFLVSKVDPLIGNSLKTKVTLLIWRIIISVIMIKVETNFSLTATNKTEIFMQTEEQ